jgi:hypothetical protein
VARRAVQLTLRSPSTWLMLGLAVALLVIAGAVTPARPRWPLSAPAPDRADRYVESLKTGNVDNFIGALAPEARTQLALAGRIAGAPGSQAERRAAQHVVAQERIDRFTRLGQHQTSDGSFVAYAVERDAPDGTHAWPLIVWLDAEGRVLRTTP